ncbi:acetyl-CoA synthetase-like protein [Punctularia strigosozonata HHB-11173 SS5]|uniref:acetyl-CoA synthetase-like protein n=1 Tax=Punctularia strigosozonata (strain HHB-11173) TaxID=741275 RepID=UPI0004417AB7|nr:acetyl-CoA synthetase-like protein [Punctularia strigosozonata HHB-11173 SS5]EIN06468.1 acetyl-CoA synthetase-like protein [Punctularia strigosozonata HHB-11173 SS5]
MSQIGSVDENVAIRQHHHYLWPYYTTAVHLKAEANHDTPALTSLKMVSPSSIHHFMHNVIQALRQYADRPAYRPYVDGRSWDMVTMRELEQHLAAACIRWREVLEPAVCQSGDVIGCCLTGKKYTDIVNVLSLCSMGFVPQLFSPNYTAGQITSMLAASQARVFVKDSDVSSIPPSHKFTVPVFSTISRADINALVAHAELNMLDLRVDKLPAVLPTDPAFIGHTSGSTAGLPKTIPQAHRWINQIYAKWGPFDVVEYGSPTFLNTFGNLAHVGSLCGVIGAIRAGSCTVQPSGPAVTAKELEALVNVAGLNTVMLYSTFLSNLLQEARKDAQVLQLLRQLRRIWYMGTPLGSEDEAWGYNETNGLKLQNYFATSECATLMISNIGYGPSASLLRIIPGTFAQMIPYQGGSEDIPLYELVLPTEAPDGPHESMYSADGWYHTNDLFELVEKGTSQSGENGDGYAYRGRANDWIKTNQGFIDTIATEDAMRRLCGDVIHDAVVVGQGQPWPVFIVETKSHKNVDEKSLLKREIIARMADWGKDRYKWERVDDPQRIIVVEEGELPRTGEKSNIK